MSSPAAGRRRIDRATAPDLLEGLTARTLDEVRDLRDDCREEESRLSFTRRLVQARLDIVRAAIDRREGRGDPDDPPVLGGLAEVLADEPPARHAAEPGAQDGRHLAGVRAAPLHDPTEDAGRRADDVMADPSLGRLPDLDLDALRALADRLGAEERRVSDLRRRVIAGLDALQAELVRRYAGDPAAVEEALSRAVERARLSGP